MSFVKQYSNLILLIISLGLTSSASWAEENQVPTGSSEIISHLNNALPFLKNGDVANATTYIKFARRISYSIKSDSSDLKTAKSALFNALKFSKMGSPDKSTKEIEKAIVLFQKL